MTFTNINQIKVELEDIKNEIERLEKVCEENKPIESIPAETKPDETIHVQNNPKELISIETKPNETIHVENNPTELISIETKLDETVHVGSKPTESISGEINSEDIINVDNLVISQMHHSKAKRIYLHNTSLPINLFKSDVVSKEALISNLSKVTKYSEECFRAIPDDALNKMILQSEPEDCPFNEVKIITYLKTLTDKIDKQNIFRIQFVYQVNDLEVTQSTYHSNNVNFRSNLKNFQNATYPVKVRITLK